MSKHTQIINFRWRQPLKNPNASALARIDPLLLSKNDPPNSLGSRRAVWCWRAPTRLCPLASSRGPCRLFGFLGRETRVRRGVSEGHESRLVDEAQELNRGHLSSGLFLASIPGSFLDSAEANARRSDGRVMPASRSRARNIWHPSVERLIVSPRTYKRPDRNARVRHYAWRLWEVLAFKRMHSEGSPRLWFSSPSPHAGIRLKLEPFRMLVLSLKDRRTTPPISIRALSSRTVVTSWTA